MATPVWLDGSLAGALHEVSEDAIEQGMYRHTPTEVYTFALVEVFQRRLVVASVKTSPLGFDELFAALLTPQAQRAAQ
jgi:hypothetical protein